MLLNWSKLPSLTALRAFEAAARAESFSAAGRSLNVTPAAVSQQVNLLEEFLGVALVRRSPRGISLTSEGRALATGLRDGFAAIAGAVDAIQERDISRPIRVTTSAYFAEAVIFPSIATFWREHPGIEISFTPSDEALDIVGEGFDLALRAGGGVWPGLQSELLLSTATVACAAPSLVDDPATDWSQVPWLIPNDTVWERNALRQSGIDVEKIVTFDVGNPSLEIRAGEEGMGIVLESEIDVRPQLLRGSLKIAPISLSFSSDFFAVTPQRQPRLAVRQFIDWLKDMCSELEAKTPDYS